MQPSSMMESLRMPSMIIGLTLGVGVLAVETSVPTTEAAFKGKTNSAQSDKSRK